MSLISRLKAVVAGDEYLDDDFDDFFDDFCKRRLDDLTPLRLFLEASVSYTSVLKASLGATESLAPESIMIDTSFHPSNDDGFCMTPFPCVYNGAKTPNSPSLPQSSC